MTSFQSHVSQLLALLPPTTLFVSSIYYIRYPLVSHRAPYSSSNLWTTSSPIISSTLINITTYFIWRSSATSPLYKFNHFSTSPLQYRKNQLLSHSSLSLMHPLPPLSLPSFLLPSHSPYHLPPIPDHNLQPHSSCLHSVFDQNIPAHQFNLIPPPPNS